MAHESFCSVKSFVQAVNTDSEEQSFKKCISFRAHWRE